MSFALDVNPLLYASDETSPVHGRAVEVLRGIAAGTELVYLFWPVLTSYMRISTHPSIFDAPLTPDAATQNVEQLLALPNVRAPGEGERFWDSYRSVIEGVTVRGNLVPDAHLVALMREYGVAEVWSRDRDLQKFRGIRVRNPFEDRT